MYFLKCFTRGIILYFSEACFSAPPQLLLQFYMYNYVFLTLNHADVWFSSCIHSFSLMSSNPLNKYAIID